MKFEFRVPTWAKIGLGLVPLFIMGYIVYMIIDGKRVRMDFYQHEIRSTVIAFSDFHDRSIEVHLEDGHSLFFLPPTDRKVLINDSIAKSKNTFTYKVYRKTDDNIKLVASYDYNSIE